MRDSYLLQSDLERYEKTIAVAPSEMLRGFLVERPASEAARQKQAAIVRELERRGELPPEGE